MAHKAGKGSTRNGRDSNAQRLGVKVYGSQKIRQGSIIIRQRGTVVMPGKNVFLSKDHTIHAAIDGIVQFERITRDKKRVCVYPIIEETKVKAKTKVKA